MFGLGQWGGVALIWFTGLLALSLVFAFLAPRLGDRNAGLMALGLSMTPFIEASHVYIGFPDTVSNFLVMVMIFWPSRFLWFVGPLLGLFNDERILVSLPLALALVLYERRNSMFEFLRSALPYATSVARL
jgi:hypothetical protein